MNNHQTKRMSKKVSLAAGASMGLLSAAALLLASCAGPTATDSGEQLVWPSPPDEPRYYYERTIRSANDVVPETTTDILRQFATGDSGTTGGLDKPFGIAAIGGRVFVGDTVGRKVAVYDIAGGRYYEIGTSGVGGLSKPLGLAVDRQGRLYVVDGTGKRVVVYDSEGLYLSAVGGQEMLNRPSGVAVNADGSRVYIVDTSGVESQEHRVRVFDGNGDHMFDFGERGDAPGQFNLPTMATVGPDGSVYIVDGANFRVQKFTPDGDFLLTFGDVGRQSGQFSRPKGIAVDEAGNIFVADAAFGNFQIFDSTGRLLLAVGERSAAGGPGKFLLPAGITVDVDGRIYVVDQVLRKVEVFRPAGLAATTEPTTPSVATE